MNTHGGKREGAGRKPLHTPKRVIKMSLDEAQYLQLKKLGGRAWVKNKLLEESNNGLRHTDLRAGHLPS